MTLTLKSREGELLCSNRYDTYVTGLMAPINWGYPLRLSITKKLVQCYKKGRNKYGCPQIKFNYFPKIIKIIGSIIWKLIVVSTPFTIFFKIIDELSYLISSMTQICYFWSIGLLNVG